MPGPKFNILVNLLSGGGSRKVRKDFDEVAESARRAQGRIDNISRSLKLVGVASAAAGAAFAARFVGQSIKAAIAFESSFAGIEKTVTATEEQFAELA